MQYVYHVYHFGAREGCLGNREFPSVGPVFLALRLSFQLTLTRAIDTLQKLPHAAAQLTVVKFLNSRFADRCRLPIYPNGGSPNPGFCFPANCRIDGRLASFHRDRLVVEPIFSRVPFRGAS